MKFLRRSFIAASPYKSMLLDTLLRRDRDLRYFYRQGDYFVLRRRPVKEMPEALPDAREGFTGAGIEDNAPSEPSPLVIGDYQEITEHFILSLRQSSPPAAVCIEQLNAAYGIRAAYLAAFALLRLKQFQEQRGQRLTKRELYQFTFAEEMREHSDALCLYEEAASYLLPGLQ